MDDDLSSFLTDDDRQFLTSHGADMSRESMRRQRLMREMRERRRREFKGTLSTLLIIVVWVAFAVVLVLSYGWLLGPFGDNEAAAQNQRTIQNQQGAADRVQRDLAERRAAEQAAYNENKAQVCQVYLKAWNTLMAGDQSPDKIAQLAEIQLAYNQSGC